MRICSESVGTATVFSQIAQLTEATVVTRSAQDLLTRGELIAAKERTRACRREVANESRSKSVSREERLTYSQEITFCLEKEAELEVRIKNSYIPQHGPRQLISPRAFLVTPLFRVASRSAARKNEVELTLLDDRNGNSTKYTGPELRQSDGLVFFALLNILRDIQVGCLAQFSPKDFCISLFGYYDGGSRNRLREHIRRLQKGQVQTKCFTVHLCHRFDHPPSGMWSVSLDKDIVALFANSHTWFDFQCRRNLPDGLTTWLYTYIEAQTMLIPMSITTLKHLCGSDSDDAAFKNTLRAALKHLNTHRVIEEGYSIKSGRLHWMKKRPD
jgi:hypothetical protein